MIRLSPQVRAGIQRSTLPALILLSGAMLVAGKTDQTMFDTLRTGLSDAAAPVLDVLSRPLGAAEAAVERVRGLVAVYQENRRLEEDNQRLLQWQQVAIKLNAENRQLQGLLKVVPDRAVSYVTARVIANSGGAYVRTVMVNAGGDGGLARGQAAITGDGLVGRLTEVGSRAARVLLITDLNSRIPVKLEGSHTSARGCFMSGPRRRSKSATGSSPRAKAASSRPTCRSAWSAPSAPTARASSPMSSCRRSAI
jgi:rod shape-determining protein MreC